jgi:hypothetical protein
MLEQIPAEQRVTVGADKGYDTSAFVAECRQMRVTPHVAQNTNRAGGSAINGRTTRHAGYALSQRKRKRIEECFSWLKTVALLRKLRHRASIKSGGSSLSRPLLITSCACANCWPRQFKPHNVGESCVRRADRALRTNERAPQAGKDRRRSSANLPDNVKLRENTLPDSYFFRKLLANSKNMMRPSKRYPPCPGTQSQADGTEWKVPCFSLNTTESECSMAREARRSLFS